MLWEEDDKEHEKKKAKGTKKCVIQNKVIIKNYKYAILKDKSTKCKQLRLTGNHHGVCTEEVNKTAISPNDDKRIQTFDKITTYQYGTNTFKVCEAQLLSPENVHRMLFDQ